MHFNHYNDQFIIYAIQLIVPSQEIYQGENHFSNSFYSETLTAMRWNHTIEYFF